MVELSLQLLTPNNFFFPRRMSLADHLRGILMCTNVYLQS